MRHDPSDTHWLGRDRFVLSCGHSSLTLYIQLYLGGFGLELSDIESLRTWGSKTPGHPEFRHTKGVEITTGPLGQGLASAVGMAMAARYERGLFDPDAAPGDQPVRPLHLRDRLRRRHGGGRHQRGVVAGGHPAARQPDRVLRQQPDLHRARHQHRAVRGRPRPATAPTAGTCRRSRAARTSSASKRPSPRPRRSPTSRRSSSVRTIIGYPAPTKMNTGGVHGSALGDDEVAATKKVLGFDPDKTFEVRDEVIAHTRKLVARGKEAHEKWQPEFDAWAAARARAQEAAGPAAGPGAARRLGRRHHLLGAGLQAAGHPRRVRPGAQRRRAEAARIVGRLGRPGGQQQHHHQGREVLRPAVDLDRGLHRRLVRPRAALRHPRARDGLDPVRHRAARADPRVRRHVPAVLRLHARRRCGWRR